MAGINGFGNNGYAYPYGLTTPATITNQGFVWVNGLEGAKTYPVARGNTILMLDSNDSLFYLKSMDLTGIISLRKFKFEEIIEPNTAVKAPEEVDTVSQLENQMESLSNIVNDLKTNLERFEDDTVKQIRFMEDRFNRFRNDKKNKQSKENDKE